MNIVLEGPDGGGKSTLAAALSRATGMPIIEGKGPPKSEKEFHYRCIDYLGYSGVIFDRHPVISDPIYAKALGRETLIRHRITNVFWATKPFIVYVRPKDRNLPEDHCQKAHESQEHVQGVEKNHAEICRLYDERMLGIAHYIYRRTDVSLLSICQMASEYLYRPSQRVKNVMPSLDHVEPLGSRWTSVSSRTELRKDLWATISPEFAYCHCNKCGFIGIAERGRLSEVFEHLIPETETVCNYGACEFDDVKGG